MTTETRSNFTQNYVPGLFACATESFKRYPEVWRSLMSVRTSKQQYEESTYKSGFRTAVSKPEGTSITFDARLQGYTKRWTHETKGLGARISEEAIDDDLYGDMADSMKELGVSLAEKKHTDVAAPFNDAFTGSLHTAGDALRLCYTAHLRLDGSTYSNQGTAADLSFSSLWTAIKAYEALRDQRGKHIDRRPRILLVSPYNEDKAEELMKSDKYPYSAENRVNSLRLRKLEVVVWHFLSSDKPWFILGEKDPSFGLIHFIRKATTFAKDSDFFTGDALFKGVFRDSTQCNLPMEIYGNAGSS
uniref:Putative capsid protein n=1 Tax=viral metagenome TaxID=1070528 RepID=A0A6M3XJG9_9ZZZZ